jgi:phage terminase large subunit-like protein
MAALQYISVPGYTAGLFRRTQNDLFRPGSIGDRARTWFSGTAARWDEAEQLFRFPSYSSLPGASIHLGHARTRADIEDRYQGTGFQMVGVEELGQWLEDTYLFLFSRISRLKGQTVPLRMRAAGNPGGRGRDWIRRRFIDDAKHLVTGIGVKEYLEMRKRGETLPEPPIFRSPPSAEAVAVAAEFGKTAQGAYFVTAFSSDNPGLDVIEYRQNLVRLTPDMRNQFEHGDWWAIEDPANEDLERSPATSTAELVKPYSPHAPSAKQTVFLQLDGEEVFFGGASGGGKSDALILAALQYVDVPEYSAGLFRQTEEDLYAPNAIGDRAKKWFAGTAAKWDAKGKVFKFPSYSSLPGATIHLGYGRSIDELARRYQGPDFQYIGCEELGQWAEPNYLYLFSRLRRTKALIVPLRMRSAGNPGGVGADWVRRRFIENARHEGTGITVKEYLKMRKAGEELPAPPIFRSPPSAQAASVAKQFDRVAQGAYFVPAYASDNPGLDVAEYMQQLARLDPATRDQFEHGDWWAAGGGDFFKEEWFLYADEAPPHIQWVRAWDLAATKPHDGNLDPDYTAGCKMGIERKPDGSSMVWIANVTRFREEPGDVEKMIRKVAESDGKKVPIHIEEEPGSGGKNTTANYAAKVLFGWKVYGMRKTGPKQEYWKPLAADAKNKLVTLVVGPWTSEFVAELCALRVGGEHSHDDAADSAGLCRSVLLEPSDLQRARAAWRR